jgi:hypothetical protein
VQDETHISGTPYAAEVIKRKNVILLGDSIGDVTMADGGGELLVGLVA